MRSRGNTLRLTAVATLIVLALTGFSTGRGHGGSSGGDSGGGCSSSSQNHDSSSTSGGGSHRDYDDDDDYDDDAGGSSGESTSQSLLDASVELVSCASVETPYATVTVTNPNAVDSVFTVTVDFQDPAGDILSTRSQEVAVTADGTKAVRVELGDDSDLAGRISTCDLGMYAPIAG
ncbi:hypothetical protein ACFYQA_38725 [Streptomyces sp. NPDC005774]|uniref:hypothetical protein n=1 Tax=Streptomyces sp. NPDC005774 TaxID=3364728 RepID=UPI0036774531